MGAHGLGIGTGIPSYASVVLGGGRVGATLFTSTPVFDKTAVDAGTDRVYALQSAQTGAWLFARRGCMPCFSLGDA